MTIDIKKFKSNVLFFIVCLGLLVILILLGLLFGNKTNNLDNEELTDGEINITSLVINEIMASNKGVIADENGNLSDYIELYNGSSKEISLKNYGLSDEESSVKWTFPDVVIDAKSYLVVYLGGKNSKGLVTNFKLKSTGGEVITLFKPNGKVIDAVETNPLDSNTVMARNKDAKWVIQTQPTPGFENTKEGHIDFIASLVSNEESFLEINEILPSNKGNFKNESAEYSGYIEIKNVGKKSIDLANYGLSNSEDASFKWQFPSVKISSGEVVVVFTSGINSKEGELNASFKLNTKNGVAVLTNNKGKVIDKVKYENLANGVGFIKQEDKFLESSSISPGYQNTVDGINSFQKKYLKNTEGLIINEVMNSNSKYLPQNGGNYYDWIELYNNSNKTITLSDYCLTTNTSTICMYQLPKGELDPGEYYIVMASGDTALSNSKYKHAGFKISETESIYLTKSKTIVDALLVSNVPLGYSMGRGSSYGVYYFSKPTPTSKNNSGTASVSYLPYSSVESGIYNDSKGFKVTLIGSGNIYYTLDGSKPTTSSKVYSSPLTIKKTTVLKVMSKESGKLKSDVQTYSYIVNENHMLPILSISINQSDLNNVNSHTALNSTVIEPSTVELLELDGSGFKINAGLKLFGGSTRSYRKKSYEIKFKKEYGDAKLNYKVFDSVDSSEYDSLVLRTGSQDEFQWSKRTLIRDIVATSLVSEYTTVDVQAYRPCVVYINGKYWGLYFIREKVDEKFVANHYNVKTTESDTSIIRIDGEVKSGTNKAYNNMISWISNNSLSNSSNYAKIKDQIDIENLCDFWIAEIWPANYDIVNTRFFSNKNIDNGKWKFIYYDLDSAFYNVNNNYYTYYTNSAGIGYGNFSTFLLRSLMKSSEFKKTFLERLSYNLKNTWSADNFIKKTDSVIEEIGEDEIKRNLSRWNVASYSEWKSNINFMKNFAKNRNQYMISQAKSYFGLSNSEVKKYFGDVK